MRPPAQAIILAQTPGALAAEPVFPLYQYSMDSSNMTANVLNEHLAKGIPALSPAAGRTATSPNSIINSDMNIDLKPDGAAWGRSNTHTYQKRWLHSDLRDMAYFYTHKLFEKLVNDGGLK